MLNRNHNPFVFATTTAILLSSTLVACVGCGDSNATVAPSAAPAPAAAAPSAETKTDALAEVLQLAKAGDIDTAIQRLVSSAPDNWIESTALEDFRMSETTFASLDNAEKARLQQRFIDRVGEIKGFAGTVMDRANDFRKKGDKATAERYLQAVHRLGRQLRDSDVVIVFQQTGKALAQAKLSE